MGSAIAPAPTDYRVERCIKAFDIPRNKIEVLWHLFTKTDREGTGHITMDDFFDKVIKYPRSGLTDSMFTLIESKSEGVMTFGEFVEVICTFCCFEKTELLRYFFYILDTQKTGLVEKNEIKHFLQMIWNHEVSSNLKEALDFLDKIDDGDGTFNFKEILLMQSKYPNCFYPLFKLQIHLVSYTLGETWWEAHKAKLIEERDMKKEKELAMLKQKQKDQAKALESVNDEVVMKRMGIVKFYLMPWLRAQERERILKIAAIESELENNLAIMKHNNK